MLGLPYHRQPYLQLQVYIISLGVLQSVSTGVMDLKSQLLNPFSYCTSLLSGTSQNNLAKLQRIYN